MKRGLTLVFAQDHKITKTTLLCLLPAVMINGCQAHTFCTKLYLPS